MKYAVRLCKSLLLPGLALLVLPALAFGQQYAVTPLVSNTGGAPTSDGNLQNSWGLTRSPGGSPWWVANNNSGTSTLYSISQTSTGLTATIVPIGPTGFVTIPPPPSAPAGTIANPTGIVFNGSKTDFLLKDGKTSAHFIFDGEDGTITAWGGGATAEIEVDNSDNGNGAVYKGATSGEINGQKYLYVTNFRSGRVEVYDTHFSRVHLGDDAFNPNGDCDRDDRDDHHGDADHHDDHHDCDERVPDGFAPFNIQNIGGDLFVTYAKQNAEKHDDVAGDGFGYVEIYTPRGKRIGHLQHGDWMNSPWGVVWTTRDFGEFSNSILVGNFGSGWIAAFDGFNYKFKGFLVDSNNNPIFIDGLWALVFGNDGSAGPANTLFFSSGPDMETNGLFGAITPVNGLDGDEE
jgi:uncharacterized protein (TIGR03118 family)